MAIFGRARTRPRPSNDLSAQKGFALLVVIVVLLLVSFLAAQVILVVRTELKIATNEKERIAARFLAEAGINIALFRMREPLSPLETDDTETIREGRIYTEKLPEGEVSYSVVNESGKIDLNRYNKRLMELFLEYHGLDSEQINTVLDSILDWRDADDLHRLNGAEKEFYEKLDDPYVPRNGAIEDPSEFFLIRGTEPLAGRFAAADVFTTLTKKNKINFNNLSAAMLDFVVEGDEAKKAAYYEEKEETPQLNEAQASTILGFERFELLKSFFTYGTADSPYYSLVATGRVGEETPGRDGDSPPGSEAPKDLRPSTTVSVVVKDPKAGTAIRYVSWREAAS